MIDVHAHVLPGVDDGARDMNESVRMLKILANQGFTGVIATPHGSRRGNQKAEWLPDLAKELQEKISMSYPGFSVYLGQEQWYHQELPGQLREGMAYTMAGSSYVLVEFSPDAPYSTLFRGIRSLTAAGYMPILAHVERYLCLVQEERIRELTSCGCVIQMNYDSLKGRWYQSETRRCRRLVEEGRVHLLGTDMHRMDFRPPQIESALAWLKGHVPPEYQELLTTGNPMKIVRGEQIL